MAGAAGEDVADHGRHLEVALDDRRPGAHQRVGAAAGDPRPDVVADLGAGGAALAGDVGERRGRGSGRPRRGGRSRRCSRGRAAGGGCSAVLIVSIECGASPERMLARLAPSAWSRPRPSEWRRSSSSASRGWLVTIARPRSFSHQRKAGMSSLEPCRRPAWQAPVCEDQSVSQRLQPVRARAQPGGEGRRRAVADRPQQDVVGEAVDLQQQQAGDLALGDQCRAAAPGA